MSEESLVELESLRELTLDLADAFKELVENGARFFEMTLANEPILDRCEQRLCCLRSTA